MIKIPIGVKWQQLQCSCNEPIVHCEDDGMIHKQCRVERGEGGSKTNGVIKIALTWGHIIILQCNAVKFAYKEQKDIKDRSPTAHSRV